jgi:hypothetical protein
MFTLKMFMFIRVELFCNSSGMSWRQSDCGRYKQHGCTNCRHPLAWSVPARLPVHGRSSHVNPVFHP